MLGRSQLNNVRESLIKHARNRRDAYLLRLLQTGGIMALLTLLLAGALSFVVPKYITDPDILPAYKDALAWLKPVCLLHLGDVLGVVFIAFVANRTITFDKVRTFDPYYLGLQALLKVNIRLATTDYLSNGYDGL